MMNYIWAGLILLSIVFAAGQDLYEDATDAWQNERSYVLHRLDGTQPPTHGQSLQLREPDSGVEFTAIWQATEQVRALKVESPSALPADWQVHYPQGDKPALLTVVALDGDGQTVSVTLEPVRLRHTGNMLEAGFDMAEFAAKLALGLIGLMSLWLGLMKIAEDSGLVEKLVRLVRPVLRPLFPDIPKGHPAMGAISLNLAANLLGLGNAATPLGIKAMQHLQQLNEAQAGDPQAASNSMIMFLALNTSSVQLLPPVTVIALLGVNAGGLFVSILLATLCSTVVAIIAAKWFARRDRRRAQNVTGP